MEIIQLKSVVTKSVSNLSQVVKEITRTSDIVLQTNGISNLLKTVTFNSTIYAEEI